MREAEITDAILFRAYPRFSALELGLHTGYADTDVLGTYSGPHGEVLLGRRRFSLRLDSDFGFWRPSLLLSGSSTLANLAAGSELRLFSERSECLAFLARSYSHTRPLSCHKPRSSE
mmetsp:Transcript_32554/g.87395  ORF Transcript_32554/g.87395 Transcript_32554/m.87395 type:complete len:117 (-) Transcript_32554:34-384(-)